MPTEVDNLIQKFDDKEWVRDAFDKLNFSIFFPKCCESFASSLSAGMQMYQAKPNPEETSPVAFHDIRDFRNWTNAYWTFNLIDITRIQLR
eukprot:UN19824